MASTSAAITAVFSTTELTEAILENLNSMFDLIRAMRVCTKFRDVIKSSSLAQQRLFMKPSWSDVKYVGWRVRPKEEPKLATFIIPDDRAFHGEARQPILTTSPVLQSAYCHDWKTTAFRVDLSVLLRWEETSSPWLQMFLTQPPVTTIWPWYQYKICPPDGAVGKAGASTTRANGLRWTDVLDFLQPFSRIDGRGSGPKVSVPGGDALIEDKLELVSRDGVVGDSLQAKLAEKMFLQGEFGGEPVLETREGTLGYLRLEGVPGFDVEEDLKPSWLY